MPVGALEAHVDSESTPLARQTSCEASEVLPLVAGLKKLENRGDWPSPSPDLGPITTVW